MSSVVRRSASRIWVEFSTRIQELAPDKDTEENKGLKGYHRGEPLVAFVPSATLRYAVPMGATVNVNGRLFDQANAVVSVFDHGFLYGEGVYETLRTYGGRPFLFDRHMRRLRNSSGMIALEVPLTNEQLDTRCRETIRAAGLGEPPNGEAYVRMLVTRGVGELSYDPAGCPSPSMVVIVKPLVSPPADVYDRGVKVALVPIFRNHPG